MAHFDDMVETMEGAEVRLAAVVLEIKRLQYDLGQLARTKQPKQRVLETALPKRGGRVLGLQGPFRGQRGKMLDKKGEAASVQLNEDFSLHNFKLDALAEYVAQHGDDED